MATTIDPAPTAPAGTVLLGVTLNTAKGGTVYVKAPVAVTFLAS